MRIQRWLVTLLLAAVLPNAVPSQAVPNPAPIAKAAPAIEAVLSGAIPSTTQPCHLNFVSQFASSDDIPFDVNSLVPNGGRCTGDLSCASKCCTNNICVPWP
ncbi:MAG TPA: hypothetical protein VMM92_01280 [Thermoanaerobaculia bacterium]|nr:hypothetical protein [Thermoanaerobaculia bacterium]